MVREIVGVVLVSWWVSLASPVLAACYPDNPLVTEDALFVSHEGVMRFARHDGRRRWRALAGEQTFEPVRVSRRLLVGTSAGLVALDADSGEVLWRRFPEATVFSPTLVGGRAFAAGRDGVLRAIDPASGRPHWTRRFAGWIYPPAFQDGVLVTGGQGATLYGLDPDTGEERWRRALSQELVYRPVAGREWVFVTTFGGELLAIEAATGALRWRHRDAVASTSPVTDRERLYLPRLDGVLQAFDQATGALEAQRALGGRLLPPHLDGGRVVVADEAGEVAILGGGDLAPLWRGTLGSPPLVAPRLRGDRLMVITGPEPRLEARRVAPTSAAAPVASPVDEACP